MERLLYDDHEENFRILRIVSLSLQCVLTLMLLYFTKQAITIIRTSRGLVDS